MHWNTNLDLSVRGTLFVLFTAVAFTALFFDAPAGLIGFCFGVGLSQLTEITLGHYLPGKD